MSVKKFFSILGKIPTYWLVSSVFLVSMIVVNWPLFHAELFHVHDFVHGARIAEMLRGLQEGQWPVRWSGNFGYGYGMPLFEFYAPFPYVVGAGWYCLSGNLTQSVKLLWLLPNILTFIGTYLLGRKLFGRTGGLIAALCFTLAPYRAVNLYIRGAISESWGMMTFPWIMWAYMEIFEKRKWAKINFTLWLIVLMLSHNLMTMIFLPMFALFALSYYLIHKQQKHSFRLFLSSVFSGVVAIGISSFYLFPALLEKQYTQIEDRILTGYFHYSQHFLYIRQFFRENWKYGGSQWGPDDDISFFLGYIQLFFLSLLALSLGKVLLTYLIKEKKNMNVSMFYTYLKKKNFSSFLLLPVLALLLILSLYFSLGKSQFIWDSVQPLQIVQFPWRFLSTASFFIALLAASTTLFTKRILRIVLLSLVFIFTLIPAVRYFQPEYYLENSEALYYSDPVRIRTEMSGILPDFIPIDVSEELHPRATEKFQIDQLPSDQYQILVDRAHEKAIRFSLPEATTVDLPIANYPGWQGFIDGEKVETQKNNIGLLTFNLPSETSLLSVKLTETPVRLTSDIISLVSTGILLYWIIDLSVSNKKKA